MTCAGEWDAIGAEAQELLRKVLSQMAISRAATSGAPTVATISVAAVIEAGRLDRVIFGESGVRMARREPLLIAYLRGAIRGLDEPVHEDGRPYTGRDDA